MATKKATTKKAKSATKKVVKKAAKKAAKKAVKKTAKKTVKKTAVKKATASASSKSAPVKKEKVAEKTVKKQAENFSGTYHYAVGRRKSAVAQVRIYEGDSEITEYMVNDRAFSVYFPTAHTQSVILSPLEVTGMNGKFALSIVVRGGGPTGQADAAKLAIARALTKFDKDLRPVLKAEGMLTRDARKVERKKPGLKKARRSPQWAKR